MHVCVAIYMRTYSRVCACMAQWVIIMRIYISKHEYVIGLHIKEMLVCDKINYVCMNHECLGMEVCVQKCKCKVCETVCL